MRSASFLCIVCELVTRRKPERRRMLLTRRTLTWARYFSSYFLFLRTPPDQTSLSNSSAVKIMHRAFSTRSQPPRAQPQPSRSSDRQFSRVSQRPARAVIHKRFARNDKRAGGWATGSCSANTAEMAVHTHTCALGLQKQQNKGEKKN